MKSTLIASVLLLASAAAAQPHRAQHQRFHEKRDIVWVTDVETVYETIESTETVWVTAGAPEPTVAAAPKTTLAATTSDVPAQFFQPSTTVVPVPTTKISTHVAPVVAPTTPVYVAPVPTTPVAPVVPETTVAPAPIPETTAPAPVVVPTPAVEPVQPSTTAAPPPATTAASSSAEHTGDITFYDTLGIGACGWVNDGTVEDVIALPVGLMGPLSNSNPYCGKMVTITLGTKSVKAKVVDKCMGCIGSSIDLSHHAFDQLDSEAVGRTTATWSFT